MRIKNIILNSLFLFIIQFSYSQTKNTFKCDSLNDLSIKKNLHNVEIGIQTTPLGYNYLRKINSKNFLGTRFGLGYLPNRGDLPLQASKNYLLFSLDVLYTRRFFERVRLSTSLGNYWSYCWPIEGNITSKPEFLSPRLYYANIYIGYLFWNHLLVQSGINLYTLNNENYKIFPRLYLSVAYQF